MIKKSSPILEQHFHVAFKWKSRVNSSEAEFRDMGKYGCLTWTTKAHKAVANMKPDGVLNDKAVALLELSSQKCYYLLSITFATNLMTQKSHPCTGSPRLRYKLHAGKWSAATLDAMTL